MTKTTLVKTLFVTLLLVAPGAQSVILDFEDFGTTNFQHGTVVDSQYNSAGYGFVTISAANDDGLGPDLAVAFDSTTPAANTTDDDLLAPFSNPTLGDSRPGNILIIQENNTGCADLVCNDPDDEGRRPAGKLTFEFQKTVELLSLDFFDVENAVGNDEDSGQPGSEVRLFDAMGIEIAANTYFTPGTGGDNTWDQLLFNGISGVRKLEINLYGSGAVDNLSYNVVPVPAAVWLFGTALLGFIGFSRRTSI